MPCAASVAATQERLKAMRVILRAIQTLEADPGTRPTTSVRIGRTTPDDPINTEASMNLRCNLRGQSPAILTIVLHGWTRGI
jgi:hypothetical protein